MKIVVDLDECVGYANCVDAAPTIFEVRDDDNRVRILQVRPPESMRKEVEKAVADCPARALQLIEEP